MLIIGDLAIKQLKPKYNVQYIEIIAFNKQISYIKNLFKASINSIRINHFTNEYDINNNRKLIIYNADNSHLLGQLLQNTFSTSDKFKMASPKILYSLEYIKIAETFNNVVHWEKSVKNFKLLLSEYIVPMNKHEPALLENLSRTSLNFYPLVTASNLINTDYYEFRKYDTYKEESLHDVYCTNKINNFRYLKYSKEGLLLDENKWKTFNYDEQISSVLERVYVIATNEFILPHWLEHKEMPENTETIFKTALMLLSSSIYSEWYSLFIVYNYNVIISKFNKYFTNILSNAIKYNDLEQINK